LIKKKSQIDQEHFLQSFGIGQLGIVGHGGGGQPPHPYQTAYQAAPYPSHYPPAYPMPNHQQNYEPAHYYESDVPPPALLYSKREFYNMNSRASHNDHPFNIGAVTDAGGQQPSQPPQNEQQQQQQLRLNIGVQDNNDENAKPQAVNKPQKQVNNSSKAPPKPQNGMTLFKLD
jgi:hypothetical protein